LGAGAGAGAAPESMFRTPPSFAPEYCVRYRQLASEIFLGGVYIRLYLKQPSFRLTNPVLFVEKLVECWEACFNIQAPTSTSASTTDSDSRALVLGNEDFLALLTSCLVCAIKAEPSVVDHLLSWGFVPSVVALLKRALNAGRRGTPMVCTVRLLLQLVVRPDVVDCLAGSKVDPVQQLTRCLRPDAPAFSASVSTPSPSDLPRDATLVVELLKRIFLAQSRYLQQFVRSARAVDLPPFLLDKVLGASAQALSGVTHASALRIHTVDLLKAIVAAADEETSSLLQALLDAHPAWEEFRHQRHDLFITDREKTDIYLIQDGLDQKFAGLLTDGAEGLSDMFSTKYAPNEGVDLASPFASAASAASVAAAAGLAAAPAPAAAPAANSVGGAGDGAKVVSAGGSGTSSRASVSSATRPAVTLAAGAASKRKSTPASTPVHASTPISAPIASTTPTPAVPPKARKSEKPPATANAPPSSTKSQITTSVHKGESGIGLDLGKNKLGMGQVLRFKEFVGVNPASLCNPPIQVGDVIVAVNGTSCASLSDTVRLIRGTQAGALVLTLERES